MATPGQRRANLERIGMREETNQDGRRVRVPINLAAREDPRPAEFAPIKTIGELWHEYVHGIGGRKPVKLWMAADIRSKKVNSNYYKRKLVSDMIAGLVNSGLTAAAAIKLVEKHYNPQAPGMSFAKVFQKIRDDKTHKRVPRELQV